MSLGPTPLGGSRGSFFGMTQSKFLVFFGQEGHLTCSSIEPLVPAQTREVQMVSYMPVKAGHDARNVYATITRIVGGYTITVAMREAGRTRTLVEKTVESQFAAETVARAYATQNNFPWQRVQLVSR